MFWVRFNQISNVAKPLCIERLPVLLSHVTKVEVLHRVAAVLSWSEIRCACFIRSFAYIVVLILFCLDRVYCTSDHITDITTPVYCTTDHITDITTPVYCTTDHITDITKPVYCTTDHIRDITTPVHCTTDHITDITIPVYSTSDHITNITIRREVSFDATITLCCDINTKKLVLLVYCGINYFCLHFFQKL